MLSMGSGKNGALFTFRISKSNNGASLKTPLRGIFSVPKFICPLVEGINQWVTCYFSTTLPPDPQPL
jgi:hypothetical protein